MDYAKECIYLMVKQREQINPQSTARGGTVETEYTLTCVVDFTTKITRIEFGAFKPHDQKLTLIFAAGRSVELYFNTSLELVSFYDFLVGLKVSSKSESKFRHVFVPLSNSDTLPGWTSDITVCPLVTKPSDPKSLEKLVIFGIAEYFSLSAKRDIKEIEEFQAKWKQGIQWFKQARSKLFALETEEVAAKFEKYFEEHFFELIREQWTDVFDFSSFSQLCAVYNLFSIVLSSERLMKQSATWQQRSDHVKNVMCLSIEAAFISETSLTIKSKIGDLKNYAWKEKIRGDKITIDAVTDIEQLLKNLTEKVNPKLDQALFNTLIGRVCEEYVSLTQSQLHHSREYTSNSRGSNRSRRPSSDLYVHHSNKEITYKTQL